MNSLSFDHPLAVDIGHLQLARKRGALFSPRIARPAIQMRLAECGGDYTSEDFSVHLRGEVEKSFD